MSASRRKLTKSKIDAFFKSAATLKKKTKSEQNLVSENESDDDGNAAYNNEVIEVDVYQTNNKSDEDVDDVDKDAANKNYILDKFLNQEDVPTTEVKPVPQARKRTKINVQANTSPAKETKIVDRDVNANADDSGSESKATYDVPPKSSGEVELDTIVDIEEDAGGAGRKIAETKMIDCTYKEILSLKVYKTDKLILNSYVLHPMVKIHIINAITGDYLKKSDAKRNVLFFHEAKVDYIGPIMTQPFDLQQNRCFQPNWNETIVINEDFNYLSANHDVIVFFEIVDFVSTDLIAKDSYGWHHLAWAFLIPSSEHHSNYNQLLRLQLFYPSWSLRKSNPPNISHIYKWWQRRKFKKYPSTLYVHLKSINAPNGSVQKLRSLAPHETEFTDNQLNNNDNTERKCDQEVVDGGDCNGNENGDKQQSVKKLGGEKKNVVWSRLDNEICQIPNALYNELDGGDEGCFVMEFSNGGQYLSYVVVMNAVYNIVILEIVTNEMVAMLPAHNALIHCLSWSKNDDLLLSTSSDCTLIIWNMHTFSLLQVLPHSTFVFACLIHEQTIITGSYDKTIRIFAHNGRDYQLDYELTTHRGYITSLCLNTNGTLLISADSLGKIHLFQLKSRYTFKKEISINDLNGVIINQILLHKREKRLIVNSRDSRLRMVDLKSNYVMQTYHECLNDKVQISGSLSPCGSFLLCGSENGCVYVWNIDNGRIETKFNPYNNYLTIHCVKYHPKDNYLAVCHYGSSSSILLYKFNELQEQDKSLLNRNNSHRITELGGDFRVILERIDHLMSQNLEN